MMDESFWWGKKVDHFLFKDFAVNSDGGLFGLCLIVFSMAFFFEYLRYLQTKHKQRELVLRVRQLKLLCPTESAELVARTIVDTKNPLNITLLDRALLMGTEISLWVVLQILGYFLMLSVMIYNTMFLVSAVLGGGLGYFVFGNLFMKLNIQNCQLMRNAFCTQICGEAENPEGQSTPAVTPSTSKRDLQSQKEENSQKDNSEATVRVQCH